MEERIHTELLTADDLKSKKIISVQDGSEPRGWRGTSYDTYVGEIITQDGIYERSVYTLPPRGIVWLVSAEDYKMPSNITGITTLRTTWTKQGILTLTVGVIDPNYEGPVSTALINFSGKPFKITRNEAFFRTVFFEHAPTEKQSYKKTRKQYCDDLIKETGNFSESFLTIDTLAPELAPKIIGMPRWALLIGVIGLGFATVLALIGILLPPVTSITNDLFFKNQHLEERIEALEAKLRELPSPEVKNLEVQGSVKEVETTSLPQ